MSIRIYPLNAGLMKTREEMHDHLYERFALAEHYGRNLDALWDMLTERGEGGVILLSHEEEMPKELLLPLLGLLTDLSAGDGSWKLKVLSKEYEGVDPLIPAALRKDVSGAEA